MVLFPVTTLCVLSVVGLGEGSVGVDGEGGCFGCDGDGFCGSVGEHVDDVELSGSYVKDLFSFIEVVRKERDLIDAGFAVLTEGLVGEDFDKLDVAYDYVGSLVDAIRVGVDEGLMYFLLDCGG